MEEGNIDPVQASNSQTVWSHDPLNITEDYKELSFMWAIAIDIYCIINLN